MTTTNIATAEAGSPHLVFDPAATSRDEAFERFTDLYEHGVDVDLLADDFFVAVQAQGIDHAVVFRRTMRGLALSRDPRRVRRDGMDHFTIQWVREGELKSESGDARLILHPGEGALLDMTRPVRNEADGRLVTISVARDRLRAAGLDPATLHLRRFTVASVGEDAWLHDRCGHTALDDEAKLDRLLSRLAAEAREAPSRRATAHELALAFIASNLADPRLSPAKIASAAGVSRATLYRLFAPLGGVAEWVQAARLQRLRALLTRTALPIAEAGRRVGITNSSHLTVAFQSRFGMTPTAFRGRHQPGVVRNGAAEAVLALSDMTGALAVGSVPQRR